MAGDWIKMRGNLWDDPRVSSLVDATNSSEAAVIGGLYWLWATADQHTENGVMPGLTLRQIDRKTGIAGLGAALVEIGWLSEKEGGVVLENFTEHNGASAKRRASDAQRKANSRNLSACDADKTTTDDGQNGTNSGAREREEEEKNPSSLRSEGKARKARTSPKAEITLPEYLDLCKAENRKPVPPDHPIRAYCEDAGITDEMRQVAWLVFKDRHIVEPGSKVKPKKYADWAAAFANSVKDRWYGLWYVSDEGDATWSPDGLQQRRVLDARMAKSREAEHAPA
ncbi:hypothetical protein [Variovorax sp. tm]|uniref:hypothetical protein n=1 Tax=Variovorax atrisoli TaxID=3394203 RepID=UPI003A7FBC6F